MGDSDFHTPLPTDSLGRTTITISSVKKKEDIQLKIMPDIDLLAGITGSTKDQTVFSQLNTPFAILNAELQPATVMIIAKEENMQLAQSNSIVAARLKQHFTSKGWNIVNEARKADYIIYMNARTIAGTERQGIYTAFASGEVSITDNHT